MFEKVCFGFEFVILCFVFTSIGHSCRVATISARCTVHLDCVLQRSKFRVSVTNLVCIVQILDCMSEGGCAHYGFLSG